MCRSTSFLLSMRRLLMAAETSAHRGKNFLGKRMFLARAEASEQSGGEHLGRDRLVDGGVDGPPSLAGVLDEAGILIERMVLRQRRGGEIEQPGRDHAAAPPDFGNVSDIEVEAALGGQRLDIGVLQDI